jgi:hypothetical protein
MSFESDYWGDCRNTFDEEQKHYTYAKLMGLPRSHYSLLASGKVLDIGGGPVSMLLKTVGLARGKVIDPLMQTYPPWIRQRYAASSLEIATQRGEDVSEGGWDEAWIYNVLQHTDDPERVVGNARRAARIVRLFEWINIPAHEGHPHELREADLVRWLGRGAITELSTNGCFGTSFSGVFS